MRCWMEVLGGCVVVSYVHVVTTGASLASNYEAERRGRRIPEAEIERRLSEAPEAERAQYTKALIGYLQRKEEEGKITEASAEVNALSRYLHEASLIYLVHTDTHLGRCCARALKAHLTGRGVQVAEPVEVQGLHSAESFQRGLANLVRQTAKILAHHRKARICATGGFKPETALVTVLGFIAQAPVYYIHEAFRDVVHLPALPINWRYGVRRHREAIEAILRAGDTGVDKDEFRERFGRETSQSLLDNWLIQEAQDRYKATPISIAILEAIQTLQKGQGNA